MYTPFPPPIRPGDSDDTHYRRLGYRVDDGVGGKVEEQPKFVKRMGGLARLYAAAAACALPSRQSDAGADHPHGLGHLWSWLASALNLRPVNDVSATLLHDVLEVAGGALGKAYGSAFLKVIKRSSKLHFAISHFFIEFGLVWFIEGSLSVITIHTLELPDWKGFAAFILLMSCAAMQ